MPDSKVLSSVRIVKQPNEKRGLRFDFSGFDEISKDGDSIVSVINISINPAGTLTLDSGTVVDYDEDGKSESVVIVSENGTNGDVHEIECLVLTLGGYKLEMDGILEIID